MLSAASTETLSPSHEVFLYTTTIVTGPLGAQPLTWGLAVVYDKRSEQRGSAIFGARRNVFQVPVQQLVLEDVFVHQVAGLYR